MGRRGWDESDSSDCSYDYCGAMDLTDADADAGADTEYLPATPSALSTFDLAALLGHPVDDEPPHHAVAAAATTATNTIELVEVRAPTPSSIGLGKAGTANADADAVAVAAGHTATGTMAVELGGLDGLDQISLHGLHSLLDDQTAIITTATMAMKEPSGSEFEIEIETEAEGRRAGRILARSRSAKRRAGSRGRGRGASPAPDGGAAPAEVPRCSPPPPPWAATTVEEGTVPQHNQMQQLESERKRQRQKPDYRGALRDPADFKLLTVFTQAELLAEPEEWKQLICSRQLTEPELKRAKQLRRREKSKTYAKLDRKKAAVRRRQATTVQGMLAELNDQLRAENDALTLRVRQLELMLG